MHVYPSGSDEFAILIALITDFQNENESFFSGNLDLIVFLEIWAPLVVQENQVSPKILRIKSVYFFKFIDNSKFCEKR